MPRTSLRDREPGMRGTGVAFVLILLAGHANGARAAEPQQGSSPGEQCATAIKAAEVLEKIPDGRLVAIGRVETGRRDLTTGRWLPWPWAIDVDGRGFYFDSKDEAIAAVRAFEAQGVRSIDVGCVQVNLLHHPDAFASLEQAFDPTSNATYGAKFLAQLFRATGNWDRAVGYYHSTTPAVAADYEEKVLGVTDGTLLAASHAPQPPTRLQQLAAAWSATLDPAPAPAFNLIVPLKGLSRGPHQPVEVAEAPGPTPSRAARSHAGGRHAATP